MGGGTRNLVTGLKIQRFYWAGHTMAEVYKKKWAQGRALKRFVQAPGQESLSVSPIPYQLKF
jgi:hypothetical protein